MIEIRVSLHVVDVDAASVARNEQLQFVAREGAQPARIDQRRQTLFALNIVAQKSTERKLIAPR